MEAFYLDTKYDISIVIPVYNATSSLLDLIRECIEVCNSINKSHEIILVDDHSKNNSWEIINEAKNKHGDLITGLLLSKNFGQHNATLCGISKAKGDYIITMDDDFEHDPEGIKLLVTKIEESKSNVVYGIMKQKRNLLRKFLTAYIKFFSNILNNSKPNRGSSYRIINSKTAKSILNNQRHFSFIDEFILWYTRNIEFVTLPKNNKVKISKSRYKIMGLSYMTKNLIVVSSNFPLRFITLIGVAMMLFNFILGLMIIYKKIVYSIPVPGYTSLIIAVLFSSGIIIFSIGILAEYISNIVKTNYEKPSFYIEDHI